MSEDLGIGAIEDSFYFVGNVPVEIDRWKRLVTGAAILNDVAFSIRPELWTTGFRDVIACNRFRTSSSVHNNSSIVLGSTSDITASGDTSVSFKGGNNLLKQSEKYVFRIDDLSLSLLASLSLSVRVGIMDWSVLIFFPKLLFIHFIHISIEKQLL